MDIWILVAALAATVLTVYAVYYWVSQIWFYWLSYPNDDARFETNAKSAQGAKNVWIVITGILGVLVAFVWTWVTGFHWNTTIAFFWPYIAGYAWCIFASKAALKRPRAITLLISVIVTLMAAGALFAVIVIARPFSTFFSAAVLTVNLGSFHWTISTYTLVGGGGLVLAAVLFLALAVGTEHDLKASIEESREKVQEKARKERESISDEALRLAIIQRLNLGVKVAAGDFPDVNKVRIRNAMVALQKEFASAALVYDSFATTLAFRNAEGVRRVHDACVKARSVPDAAETLVQSFIKELGLPETLPARELSDPFFFVAKAQAGSLTSVLPPTFPIFVPTMSELQIREEKVRDLFQNRFNEAKPQNRFGVVLSPSDSALLRRLLTEPEEGVHENIVYLNEDDMRTVITSNAPDIKTSFMKLVRRNVRLTTVAPFVTKGPAKGEMFVGREREINNILQNMDSRSYAILGGRRIGKTSMVKQIQLRLQSQGYKVLDLDCDEVMNYEEFYRLMIYEWTNELGAYRPAKDDFVPITFREFVAVLSASHPAKSPLVFVFDEIDKLLMYDMEPQNREQLFRTFRDLSQRQRCQFIFNGERRIYKQLSDSSSPLFNFCMPIKLGLLSQDDARKLIEEPFERLDIPLEGGRALTDCIIDICSHHPNLIQKVCLELLTELDNSGDTVYPKITQDLLLYVTHQPKFRKEYMQVFWGQSSPLEKAITLIVRGDESVDPSALATRLQQQGFQVSQEQLDTALDYLTLYCVFQYDTDGIKWAATHFDEFASEEIFDRKQRIDELRYDFLLEQRVHT